MRGKIVSGLCTHLSVDESGIREVISQNSFTTTVNPFESC
jgi:hypothetical protein